MLQQTQPAPATAELLGDLRPLIEQLGSSAGLAALAGGPGSLPVRRIITAADLQQFLQNYHARILQPFELPAIQRAFTHARKNEVRELIAWDQQLAGEPILQNFAAASRCAGLSQLQRLRPLRDERVVQRYLGAVERGEANGWHTLVYGLTLAVYSLPLRQGLVGYALQTTRGFLQSAARSLALSETDSTTMLASLSAAFPASVESLLAQGVIG
jgi:urease accessory protein UreF